MTLQLNHHSDMFLDANSSSSCANWELEEPSHTHTFKEIHEFQESYTLLLSMDLLKGTHREPWSLPTQNRDFYRPKWRFRAKKKPHPVVFDVGWVLGTQSPLPSASTSSSCVEPCWAPALQLKFLSEIRASPYIFVACINRQIIYQWIGLRENLQETSIFNGKNHGFLQIFPQSNDWNIMIDRKLWYKPYF